MGRRRTPIISSTASSCHFPRRRCRGRSACAGHFMKRWLFIAALLLATPAWSADAVHLYAAGSLRDALDETRADFTQATGIAVEAKYGPSGLLKDESAAGANADVFASANMDHPQ